MSIRRERKDALEHRQLILHTAKALFSQHGVQSVSMHQIAKTAGIGQATLYRRYAHKGDLCFDILQDYSQQIMVKAAAYIEDKQQAPAVERLGGLLGIWIDSLEETSDLLIAMEAKMNCEDQRGSFFHSPIYLFIRDHLSQLLSEIVKSEPAEQELPIDADLTAHAIICSLSPVGYYHMKQEKNYSKEQMKHCYRQMCFRLARIEE